MQNEIEINALMEKFSPTEEELLRLFDLLFDEQDRKTLDMYEWCNIQKVYLALKMHHIWATMKEPIMKRIQKRVHENIQQDLMLYNLPTKIGN